MCKMNNVLTFKLPQKCPISKAPKKEVRGASDACSLRRGAPVDAGTSRGSDAAVCWRHAAGAGTGAPGQGGPPVIRRRVRVWDSTGSVCGEWPKRHGADRPGGEVPGGVRRQPGRRRRRRVGLEGLRLRVSARHLGAPRRPLQGGFLRDPEQQPRTVGDEQQDEDHILRPSKTLLSCMYNSVNFFRPIAVDVGIGLAVDFKDPYLCHHPPCYQYITIVLMGAVHQCVLKDGPWVLRVPDTSRLIAAALSLERRVQKSAQSAHSYASKRSCACMALNVNGWTYTRLI